MPRHCIAALLLLLSTLACTPFATERAHSDEASATRSEDPALRRAMEKAQATLDDFLTKAKQQPAGTSAYALRVRVQDGPDIEYFWVEEFTWTDGSFTGRINSEPRLVKSATLGQIYKFSRSQVTDWKYLDEKNGRTLGNFTACALDGLDCP